ncbi:MAG TPA: enoyl-CoA hydratase/isomerase family protein [Deltaproteobacteria bacterium]|jgi:enoyl-CoA hydratase/carnithine racemase|nr:enoyl-CoA hydratase/isomerase family protein [Deltaproteobacteria bacterium]
MSSKYEGFSALKLKIERGVAWVTIDHPPINLFDLVLIQEMDRMGRELESDDAVRVVVLQSANPDFFIAHADVTLIQQLPKNVPSKPTSLGWFHQMVDRFRTMPKATIGKIEGRARGGGSELLLSLDMRFGAIGRAILSQPEVAVGIIPGGSGTQRLPRLIGRGRALEAILGCQDFSAELAERYGYINRALPAHELTPFVERLAYRIASFPAPAIAMAKASVNAAELPTVEGLLEEAHFFNQTLATQEAQERMAAFMAAGGQTYAVELAGIGA